MIKNEKQGVSSNEYRVRDHKDLEVWKKRFLFL